MAEHRYLEAAHRFDDELVADLSAHAEEQGQLAEEKNATLEAERRGGLDAVVKGTPLDQVKAIIEKKKRSPEQLLKEHEVGKKMAAMAGRRLSMDVGELKALSQRMKSLGTASSPALHVAVPAPTMPSGRIYPHSARGGHAPPMLGEGRDVVRSVSHGAEALPKGPAPMPGGKTYPSSAGGHEPPMFGASGQSVGKSNAKG